jgi:Zn-dependent protease with chaperone function
LAGIFRQKWLKTPVFAWVSASADSYATCAMLIDSEKIARYEALAKDDPNGYRHRLAFIAVMGDIVLTILRMIPIALLVAFSSLFYGGWFFQVLAVSTLLLFLWLGRPDFRIDGRVLVREDAPELFAEIDKLCAQLSVSGKFEVRINDEFNAGATETRGLFGIIGTRRVLVLGVPLLAILDKRQVLAIIAHEFGHLSRRHGRLGHWLYRTRVGWLMYEESNRESDAILERAISWYGRAFVPYFSALSFVHSRRCEYEADADAASVVGAPVFGEALSALMTFDGLWEKKIPEMLAQQIESSATVPGDFTQQLSRAAREAGTDEKSTWLLEAMQKTASATNTHPSLRERLAELNVAPQLDPLDDIAGEELLGKAWHGIQKTSNESWQSRERLPWLLQHAFHAHVARDLLAAEDEAVMTWSADRTLARARALAARDMESGLAAMKQLYKEHSGDDEVTACYALTCLAQNNIDNAADGVNPAEALWQRAPRYRRKIAGGLVSFYERKEDFKNRDAWQTKLEGVTAARSTLVEEFVRAVEADVGKTHIAPAATDDLAEPVRNFLAAAIRQDQTICAAWAFGGSLAISLKGAAKNTKATGTMRIHLLALVIDPAAMKICGAGEDEIEESYRSALGRALPIGDECIVTTYFMTEKLPERFTADNVFIDKRTTTTRITT